MMELQENKHNLLIDLSERLFTDTLVEVKFATENPSSLTRILIPVEGLYYLSPELLGLEQDEIILKPYLRKMSSMTEEEDEEWHNITNMGYFNMATTDIINGLDFLRKHYFDYRGLIEKGLAIRVTKENNPYNS